MPDVWFTADDLEEILSMDRTQIESLLVSDGQILPEEAREHWAVDLDYADRLVLAMISRLPDQAEETADDASSLLLRYALTLVHKQERQPWMHNCGLPSFEAVQKELESWEDRVRPLLRNYWCSARPPVVPEHTSVVHVR